MTLGERLWSGAVETEDGCWEWRRTRNRNGYGQIGVGGKTKVAHRVAYELAIGPIADGLQLDHLCRNRACINPAHLEPVTQSENIMRGSGFPPQLASRTHCLNGHELHEGNIYRQPGRPAHQRSCLTCRHERDRVREQTRPTRPPRRKK